MVQFHALPADTEETEVAAALSAVMAFIATADNAEEPQAKTAFSKTVGWKAASRLEAAGLARAMSGATRSKRSLWKTFVVAAALLASGLTGGLKAKADTARDKDANDIAAAALQFSGHGKQRTPIRVGLVLKAKGITFDAVDGARIINMMSGATVATLPAQSSWSLNIQGAGNLAVASRGNTPSLDKIAREAAQRGNNVRNVGYFPSRIQPLRGDLKLPTGLDALAPSALPVRASNGYLVVPGQGGNDDDLVALNGKLYRGCLWIRPTADAPAAGTKQPEPSVSVINILDLEDYLLSVLPSEMPATWPAEALKAQAVAARSYAVANLGKHAKDGFDVKATIEDQVYSGVSAERDSTNRAVAETEGVVIKFGGKVITAFFHSAGGGFTELSENVWGRNLPYLKSVPDYDDASPHFAWTRQFTPDSLEKAFGQDLGQILNVMILTRSSANRVQDALLVGSNGTRYVTGDVLRSALKLPSTVFNVGCDENGYTFAGRGFGHGLGLSQWGAKALAEQGYNAAQILTYYYKDVSVESIGDALGI
jgi:stage II sporulation protein D